jgi:hypothetical protein
MGRLNELIKWLNNIDPEELKGSQLTNNDVEWLIQQALEKEYYEMLFHTYYDRSRDYFNSLEKLQNEMNKHIQFLDKIHKGWEDQWNFEAMKEENKELKDKLRLTENKNITCPECKTNEHLSFETYLDEDENCYEIAYCDKCQLIVWEEQH